MKNCRNKKALNKFIFLFIMTCLVIGYIENYGIVNAMDNQWITEDFELPVALRGACVEYVDGKIYVIGGDKGFSPVNTVHIYDINSNIWSIGTSLEQPIAFANSSMENGKIYIFGGQRFISGKYSAVDDFNIYDISTNTWKKGKMPFKTTYAKSIIYSGKIYIFAGLDYTSGEYRNYHNIIQIYDIKKNIWVSDTIMPFNRFGYTLNLIEDKAYLIGGSDGTASFNDVKIYDLITGTWSDGSKMNIERDHANSSEYNNKIYVFGGTNPALLNSTDIYDIVTDTWTKGSNFTTEKRCMSSIIVDSKLYLIGGETNTNLATTTKSIESFQLPPADNRLFSHLYVNEKIQLSFSHVLTNNQSVNWVSSSPRVATVDSDGIVIALGLGTAYITAYNKDGTFIDYIPVIVTNNNVYRIAVHINLGQTLKLYLEENANNIKWYSMDQNVATISGNGQVTGCGQGLTVVKAEYGGEEYYIYVRVN